MTGLLLIFLCFCVALLAIAIFLQPDRYVVTRSAVIDAAPDKVFRAINNLRNWESWSPWAALDPQAAISYDGPAVGPGAAFEWSGNKNVGAGRLTIVDSHANGRVDIKLDMRKPFAASNDVSFILTPDGDGAAPDQGWLARTFGFGGKSAARTHVAWSMSGRAGLIAKAINLVANRDRMVGGQFEKGLANLNALLAK